MDLVGKGGHIRTVPIIVSEEDHPESHEIHFRHRLQRVNRNA